jgi:hypothetical protein
MVMYASGLGRKERKAKNRGISRPVKRRFVPNLIPKIVGAKIGRRISVIPPFEGSDFAENVGKPVAKLKRFTIFWYGFRWHTVSAKLTLKEGHAAVDIDGLADHGAGHFGAEEQDGLGNFVGGLAAALEQRA